MRRAFYIALCLPAFALGPPARFVSHPVAGGLNSGYQVAVADMNRDGRPDLIGLATGLSELAWFQNPTWERHVIADGFKGLINVAPFDYDRNGIPELIVASAFSSEARNSAGLVQLLRHNGDPRNRWTVTEIDRLPTSHRLRWADFEGHGRKVVINAPLTGASAGAPDYRGSTPLVYYRPGEWKRRIVSTNNEGVVHGLAVLDWDGDGRDELLTAGFGGIHLFDFEGDRWSRTALARGDPSPCPKCGSSEVAVGSIAGKRYVCSIDPWHGNQVAVYVERGGAWQRHVIDSSFVEGHTLLTVDVNADRADEIVAGYRGAGHAIYIYYPLDNSGEHWSRRLLDDSVAAASCAAADLNGDGRIDLACIGGSTANLNWYENAGATPAP